MYTRTYIGTYNTNIRRYMSMPKRKLRVPKTSKLFYPNTKLVSVPRVTRNGKAVAPYFAHTHNARSICINHVRILQSLSKEPLGKWVLFAHLKSSNCSVKVNIYIPKILIPLFPLTSPSVSLTHVFQSHGRHLCCHPEGRTQTDQSNTLGEIWFSN